jgi:hypothetical protein
MVNRRASALWRAPFDIVGLVLAVWLFSAGTAITDQVSLSIAFVFAVEECAANSFTLMPECSDTSG